MQKFYMKDAVKMAKELFMEKGDMPTQIFVVEKDVVSVLALMFDGNNEKEIMMDKARAYIAIKKPKRYFFVSPSWMLKQQNGENPSIKPSQSVHRKEVIMIVEFNSNLKTKAMMIPVHRKCDPKTNKETITFGKESNFGSGIETRWNFFLEKQGLNEKADQFEIMRDEDYKAKLLDMMKEKYEKVKNDKMKPEEKVKKMKEIAKDIIEKEKERLAKEMYEDGENN